MKGDVRMKIRFDYVSHALALWDCSPAKMMTFTRWKQLNKQERDEKLYDVTKHFAYKYSKLPIKSKLTIIYIFISNN